MGRRSISGGNLSRLDQLRRVRRLEETGFGRGSVVLLEYPRPRPVPAAWAGFHECGLRRRAVCNYVAQKPRMLRAPKLVGFLLHGWSRGGARAAGGGRRSLSDRSGCRAAGGRGGRRSRWLALRRGGGRRSWSRRGRARGPRYQSSSVATTGRPGAIASTRPATIENINLWDSIRLPPLLRAILPEIRF